MTPPGFLLVGNPDNRRVALFQAALARRGLAPARVVSWRTLAEDVGPLAALPDVPTLVRLESFGEDDEVERAFLRRGAPVRPTLDLAAVAALVPERGRIVAPRQHHEGFLAVLRDVTVVLESKRRWRALTPPWAIEELFDKRATARTFASLGVPIAPWHDASDGLESLRARLDSAQEDRVYVKLTCGSSASCLALWTRRPRESVITSLELAHGGRMYNSLRLRKYDDRPRIDRVLEFLLGEGAHVERALTKARVDRRFFDCRVLTVAGEPAFTVVRTSPHPITNLHLGGRRGALPDISSPVLDAAMESCRVVARHYSALHLGIDLMFERDLAGHRILEANAFGDLLPNLERDGLDVYGWQIRAALALDVT